ncbi:MAG: hypothetical protein ACPG5B_11045 [Chitinophagales bacterium]
MEKNSSAMPFIQAKKAVVSPQPQAEPIQKKENENSKTTQQHIQNIPLSFDSGSTQNNNNTSQLKSLSPSPILPNNTANASQALLAPLQMQANFQAFQQQEVAQHQENNTLAPQSPFSNVHAIQKAENENQQETPTTAEPTTISDVTEQVMYELVAHGMAYSTTLNREQSDLLNGWGYQPDWAMSINDQKNAGFFAGLLLPSPSGIEVGRKPILAFRGSEVSELSFLDQFVSDWLHNDMDPYAVGYTAFMANYEQIQNALATASGYGANAVVVGHSLGGSLAKQAVVAFPSMISRAVTFQAPGINNEQAAAINERLQNGEFVPEVVTHTAQGDIVHLAGDARMPKAQSSHHDPSGILAGNTPLAHTLYLLSSPKYVEQQNELLEMFPGMTWEQMLSDAAGATSNPDKDAPEPINVDSSAEPLDMSGFLAQHAETFRDFIGENFQPQANIINNEPQSVAQMPVSARINILQEFMKTPSIIETLVMGAVGGGAVGTVVPGAGTVSGAIIGGVGLAAYAQYNDWANTQEALLHIIRESNPQDTVTIIDAVGGIGAVADRLSFTYTDDFRATLNNRSNGYYVGLTPQAAATLIINNFESGFWELDNYQEVIIADILTSRSDGDTVLTLVGFGNYDKGLEKVLRKLEGQEDDQISRMYSFRDRDRGWFW